MYLIYFMCYMNEYWLVYPTRGSTESWPWRRKFSRCSSNLWLSDHKRGALSLSYACPHSFSLCSNACSHVWHQTALWAGQCTHSPTPCLILSNTFPPNSAVTGLNVSDSVEGTFLIHDLRASVHQNYSDKYHPSKHVGYNLHPIHISLEVSRSRPDDFCKQACSQTRSVSSLCWGLQRAFNLTFLMSLQQQVTFTPAL